MADDIETSEGKGKLISKVGKKFKKIIGMPLERRSVITLEQISSAGVDSELMPEEEHLKQLEEERKLKEEKGLEEEKIESPEIASFDGRLDKEKIIFMVEKLGQQVEFIKELKTGTDERIDKLSGELGELRSMFLEREKETKDALMEFEKIKSIMEDLEPNKIILKFQKIEKESLSRDAKLEKNEAHIGDIRKKAEKVQRLLDKIGNFENIIKIHNLMNDKLSKMNEKEKKVEVLSAKSENTYFEMEKRLNKIKNSLDNIERLEEITKDILKEIDLLKLKAESFVDEEDFDKAFSDFKSMIEEKAEENTNKILKELDNNTGLVKDWTYGQFEKIVSRLAIKGDEKRELEAKKEKISWFLKELEKQHKSNLITGKTYNDVKKKNLAELEKIDSILKDEKLVVPFYEFTKTTGEPEKEGGDKAKEGETKPGPQRTKEPEKPMTTEKVDQSPEKTTVKDQKVYLGGSRFLEMWEKLTKGSRFETLSKREKQLLSILYSSEATNKENSIPVKNLAKSIYREEYDHDKLSYTSRIVGNLEKEGYVVKIPKGRESLIYLNLPKIEGKKEAEEPEKPTEQPKEVKEEVKHVPKEELESKPEEEKSKEKPGDQEKKAETKEAIEEERLTEAEAPKKEEVKAEKPKEEKKIETEQETPKTEPKPEEKPKEVEKSLEEESKPEELKPEKNEVPPEKQQEKVSIPT
ncbi:MAG: hypothetical protein ISS48_03500 [Candidatus Aenigmarchaeota archaeon]|nr:hypothetical protein [Candidatus Aenigmarchaeota archaeon]